MTGQLVMLVVVKVAVVNFSQHFILKDFESSKIVLWKYSSPPLSLVLVTYGQSHPKNIK